MDRATRLLWDMHCGRKDRKLFNGSSPAIFSDPSENAGISLFHVL
jgi:hypothetical protein